MKYYEKPELSIKVFMVADIVRTSLGDNETPWDWDLISSNMLGE